MSTIREATLADVKDLLAIYDYYVKHTAISFECTTPTLEEFTERMRGIKRKYPYFVAEQDGKVVGYACAHPFVGREAYDWSCEMTIYVDHDVCAKGIGGKLYIALEEALKKMGILNLYACIGHAKKEDEHLTNNSEQFHAHMGYHLAGTFENCGYKFGRWYDMIWMEKVIGTHQTLQKPVVPYPEIEDDGVSS